MQWLFDGIANPFLFVPLSAWAAAQVLKVIVHLCMQRKLDLRRLFGDGGMPSGHSATVAALTGVCALRCGTASVEFALAAVLAVIVCHDAMGVRQETGKQAMLIDEIVRTIDELKAEKLPQVKLKKFVGHTFVQVLAGVAIGIGVALILLPLFPQP